MSHTIPLHFEHQRRQSPGEAEAARAWAEPGRIRLRAGLSLGSPGWQIKATAWRRRRHITLSVCAVQTGVPAAAADEMEDVGYAAVLEGLKPGRYQVQVSHLFKLRDTSHPVLTTSPYHFVVEVP